ncbi:MAG: carboxypeptidase regulatory-like domain-containing protein [Planctomycetes bacterium]|nr:carboxypeptidase regulatory-like domain-containing protein [Planctomycetota bacterium]
MKRLAPLLLVLVLATAAVLLFSDSSPAPPQLDNPSETGQMATEAPNEPFAAPLAAPTADDAHQELGRTDTVAQHFIRVFDAEGLPAQDAHILWKAEDGLHGLDCPDGTLHLDEARGYLVSALHNGAWAEPLALSETDLANTDLRLDAIHTAAQLRVLASGAPGSDSLTLDLKWLAPVDWEKEKQQAADMWREFWTEQPRIDADGVLTLGDIPPGHWSFLVSADGMRDESLTLELHPGQIAEHTLSMQEEAWITARVLNEQGKPLADAWGFAFGDSSTFQDELANADLAWYVIPATQPKRAAVTSEDGLLRVKPQAQGTWRLALTADGMLPAVSAAATIVPGQTADLGDITLISGRSLSIRILAPNGDTLPEASLEWMVGSTDSLTAASATWRPAGDSDAQGEVHLTGLPHKGAISLRVTHAEFARASLEHTFQPTPQGKRGDQVDAEWVEMQMGQPFRVTGRVIGPSGQAVATAKVRLSPGGSDVDFSVFREGGSQASLRTEVDESGAWVIPNAPEGSWKVVAQADDFSMWLGEDFALSADQPTHDETCTLTQGAELVVLVPEAVGTSAVVRITVTRLAGETAKTETLDAQGRVVFSHLPAGEYQVRAIFLEDMDAGANRLDNLKMLYEMITLAKGDYQEIELGTSGQAGILEGVVTQAGVPVAAQTVLLIGGAGMKTGTTDETGRYRIEDIAPDFYLTMIGEVGGAYGSTGHTVTIEVLPGNQTQDFELPEATFSIVVLSEDGTPLQGIPVNLRGEDAPITMGGGTRITNAEGLTHFLYVRPGAWVVTVGKASMPILGEDDVHGSTVLRFVIADTGSPEPLEVRLPAAATFKARVLDPDGVALPGAMLFYLDESGQPLSNLAMKPTNSKGVAQLKGLPAGKGLIHARHPQFGIAEIAVQLTGGETTKAEIQLEPGTILKVQATNADGEPITGVFPVAIDERGSPVSMLFGLSEAQQFNLGLSKAMPTPLGPLAPGEYKIVLGRAGGISETHIVTVPPGGGEMSVDLVYTH